MEEEEQQQQQQEKEVVANPHATVRTCYFRLEPDVESLGEVTAWLRHGMRGNKGLAALERLDVRCDELGPLPETAVDVAGTVLRLVAAAMALPKLYNVVVAWLLPGLTDENGMEAVIRDTAWQVLKRGRPPPPGHHLEAVVVNVPDPRGPWRSGLLAVSCWVRGARPAVMEVADIGVGAGAGKVNNFHLPSMQALNRQFSATSRTEYRFVRLASPEAGAGSQHGVWPGSDSVPGVDDNLAYDLNIDIG